MQQTRKLIAALIGVAMFLSITPLLPAEAQPSDSKSEEATTGEFEPFETPASEKPTNAERITSAATGRVESIPQADTIDIQEMLDNGPLEFENPLQALIDPVATGHQTRGAATTFGRSPFAINIPFSDRFGFNDKAKDRSVELEILRPDQAGNLAERGTVFTLRVDGYGNRGGRLPSQASNGRRFDASEPAEVDLGAASGWELTMDYGKFCDPPTNPITINLTIRNHSYDEPQLVA